MTLAEDTLLDCPLEKCHRILKSRMQYHLVRCSRNFELSKLNKLKCPYNPLHIVEGVEIMHHCSHCEDNASIQTAIYDVEPESNFDAVTLEEINHELSAVGIGQWNDWDDQCTVGPAYNPNNAIVNQPVFRTMIRSTSKAKRKQFRLEEHKRISELEENMGACKLSQQIPVEVKEPKEMRRPRAGAEKSFEVLQEEPSTSENAQKLITVLRKPHSNHIKKVDARSEKENEETSLENCALNEYEDTIPIDSVDAELKKIDEAQKQLALKKAQLLSIKAEPSKPLQPSAQPMASTSAVSYATIMVEANRRSVTKCAANFNPETVSPNTNGGNSGVSPRAPRSHLIAITTPMRPPHTKPKPQ